jgi:hypothetical protein
MSHLRQQVRERVGTILTGLTTTGSNVFQSRLYPMEKAKLPGLIIYSISEAATPITSGSSRTLQAQLTLAVEVYATGSNLDDTLDTVCSEVQEAMAGDRQLNGLAKDLQLDSTEITFAQEQETDIPAGYATMNWSVFYNYAEDNTSTAL